MIHDRASHRSADIANPFIAALADDARDAGLRYSSDQTPGIRRVFRRGKAHYLKPDGSKVRDRSTLVRIKRLVIPPAWTDVWISPHENGHIQAVGRDARGRKQYRYHDDWRRQRDGNKFDRMVAFARVLPKIRRRVARDLRRKGVPREKILATVISLLESTLIRVGNDDYARHNGSYGLTTMQNRHAKVKGPVIHFTFKGKSGKRHAIAIEDPHLARIVRRCQDLPGQDLFGYEDESGAPHDLSSQDVNAYLREVSGSDFTAKDFRTWAGTVLTSIALRHAGPATSQRGAKKNVAKSIESVARLLGNTPAVCRKCYIHPTIVDAYLAGRTVGRGSTGTLTMPSIRRLRDEEKDVLALLKAELRKANNKRRGPSQR